MRRAVSDGKELSYIEGWFALTQANRIFGFDGWDRETIETKCVQSREVRGVYTATYFARVKISVRTNDHLVVRDGHGTGEARGNSAGEVHDRALKTAETDATKRALATFGKAFGLTLHASARGSNPTYSATIETSEAPPPFGDAPALPSSRVSESTVRSSLGASDTGAIEVRINGEQPQAAGRVEKSKSATGQRVEKHTLTFSEPKRTRDKGHLLYVSAQPCLLCNVTPSDAHHVRFAQPRAMGRKVGDEFTVPLCRNHHRELHDSGNEATWWHDMGIDPMEIARQLWSESD